MNKLSSSVSDSSGQGIDDAIGIVQPVTALFLQVLEHPDQHRFLHPHLGLQPLNEASHRFLLLRRQPETPAEVRVESGNLLNGADHPWTRVNSMS